LYQRLPGFFFLHNYRDLIGFWPVFGNFLRASGPLFKVDHWRGAFPSFCPVFGGSLESFLAIIATYSEDLPARKFSSPIYLLHR